jgi:hypothetical protein
MSRIRSLFSHLLIVFVVSALYACAGAGPDLRGPEGPGLMAAFSGEWVLVLDESEDLNEKMRGAMRDPSAGMPGGGMTGGRTGRGGMGGGRPGGMGGGRGGGGMRGGGGGMTMDPEEMRAAMDALRQISAVPDEMVLTLQVETVTLATDAANILVLTLGANEEEIGYGPATLFGTARWKKDGLEIERETEMGSGVKDVISVDQDGKLIVKREVDLMNRNVKGTLVYQRKSGAE